MRFSDRLRSIPAAIPITLATRAASHTTWTDRIAPGHSAETKRNRAVHFAGGRLAAELEGLLDTYSIELWFWNGLPNDARAITGVLASFGGEKRWQITMAPSLESVEPGSPRVVYSSPLARRTTRITRVRLRSHPRPGTT